MPDEFRVGTTHLSPWIAPYKVTYEVCSLISATSFLPHNGYWRNMKQWLFWSQTPSRWHLYCEILFQPCNLVLEIVCQIVRKSDSMAEKKRGGKSEEQSQAYYYESWIHIWGSAGMGGWNAPRGKLIRHTVMPRKSCSGTAPLSILIPHWQFTWRKCQNMIMFPIGHGTQGTEP